MNKLKPLLALICLMLLLPLAGTAAAETPPGDNPCAADAKRLCPDVKPGSHREAMRCLKEHEQELSPACRERAQAARDHMQKARAACEADVGKYCADVKPGSGQVASCLKNHEADLAPACREQLKRPMRQKGTDG